MFGWFRRYVGTFEGKAVLITGCDTGFGRLMALKFCEEGAHVFAACLTEKGATALSQEARGKGKITTVPLDVTKAEQVQKAYDVVKAELATDGSSLYAIVNNAGVNRGWYAEMTDMKDYRLSMEVNFFGPVQVSKAFLPLLQNPGGRLIGVVSAAGTYAMKGLSAYSASKFAHTAFMDAVRNELRGTGIKVVKVMPGGHRTAALDTYEDDIGARKKYADAPEDVKKRYAAKLDEEFLARGEKYSKSFGDPINVVNAVRDGALLKNPRTVYYVGSDARIIGKCFTMFPPRMADCVQNMI